MKIQVTLLGLWEKHAQQSMQQTNEQNQIRLQILQRLSKQISYSKTSVDLHEIFWMDFQDYRYFVE